MKPQRVLSAIAAATLVATLGACSSLSTSMVNAAPQPASPVAVVSEASPSESQEPTSDPSETPTDESTEKKTDAPTEEPTPDVTNPDSHAVSERSGYIVPDMRESAVFKTTKAISEKLAKATSPSEAKAAINANFCTWQVTKTDEFGTYNHCVTEDGTKLIVLFAYNRADFEQTKRDANNSTDPKLVWAYTDWYLFGAMPSTIKELASQGGKGKSTSA